MIQRDVEASLARQHAAAPAATAAPDLHPHAAAGRRAARARTPALDPHHHRRAAAGTAASARTARAAAAAAGVHARHGRRVRLAEGGREVQPPADFLLLGLLEVERPRVDRQQIAVLVAGEPLGQGGFQLGRDGREGGDGTVRLGPGVVGREAQVLVLQRRQVDAQLQGSLGLFRQVEVAAFDTRDGHRPPRGEVVDRHVRGRDGRVVQLRHRRRLLLVGPAGGEVDRLPRRPVQSDRIGRQPAEVGQVLIGQVQIGRQVA
ncbi:hypothetical protein D3C73_504180 [compost metagenome]